MTSLADITKKKKMLGKLKLKEVYSFLMLKYITLHIRKGRPVTCNKDIIET